MPKPSLIPLEPSGAQGAASGSGERNESVPKRGRRRFSAAEKLRIVRAAAACTKRGELEALLRHEGIYSSHLANWRKQLNLHGSESLAPRKRGRKPKLDANQRRIVELERQNTRLERKLRVAEQLIELQKKASILLGIDLTESGDEN